MIEMRTTVKSPKTCRLHLKLQSPFCYLAAMTYITPRTISIIRSIWGSAQIDNGSFVTANFSRLAASVHFFRPFRTPICTNTINVVIPNWNPLSFTNVSPKAYVANGTQKGQILTEIFPCFEIVDLHLPFGVNNIENSSWDKDLV